MKNQIPNGLFTPSPHLPQTMATPAQILQETQMRFNQGQEWIETYVQEHPAVGMGAAFCLGVLIGWASKRW
jgi:ElaB/YqjD/DUF883 family membrane-anchored ribosome-binding protein